MLKGCLKDTGKPGWKCRKNDVLDVCYVPFAASRHELFSVC
jgi:hypothetical protein